MKAGNQAGCARLRADCLVKRSRKSVVGDLNPYSVIDRIVCLSAWSRWVLAVPVRDSSDFVSYHKLSNREESIRIPTWFKEASSLWPWFCYRVLLEVDIECSYSHAACGRLLRFTGWCVAREWTRAQLHGPRVSVPLNPGRKDDGVGVGLESHL
jgi:hypothetical protein